MTQRTCLLVQSAPTERSEGPTPLVLRLLQLPPRGLEEALKLPEHIGGGLGVPGGAAWVHALPHRLP